MSQFLACNCLRALSKLSEVKHQPLSLQRQLEESCSELWIQEAVNILCLCSRSLWQPIQLTSWIGPRRCWNFKEFASIAYRMKSEAASCLGLDRFSQPKRWSHHVDLLVNTDRYWLEPKAKSIAHVGSWLRVVLQQANSFWSSLV